MQGAPVQEEVNLAPRQFNRADELEHYETFFPAGTKSLLSKCMTKNVWE